MALRPPWGLQVGSPTRSGLVAIHEGSALLTTASTELVLNAGDLCILPEPGQATLSDGGSSITAVCPDGPCTRLQCDDGEPATAAIVGSFELVDRLAHPFLAQLPPLLHLTSSDTKGRIEGTLALLHHEANDIGLGSALAIARLFELLFIQTLRAYLERSCTVCEHSGASWLRAVTDPALHPALEAIHHDPLEVWTVDRLAQHAGMSRTTFAVRFTQSMGYAPVRYVTRWRLHLAAAALAAQASLSTAAEAAGYASEAAFAKAFKREVGESPGRFRARH